MNQPTPRQKKNIEQRIGVAATVRNVSASERDDLGYMARLLVQMTLPHSDPGDVPAYGRVNGDTSLVIQPGVYLDQQGRPRGTGIPYGVYPRLVLAWITTEAVRTKSRELKLGGSLSSFMGELGLTPTGGRWGTITRLRDQMDRLFRSRITINEVGEGRSHMDDISVVRRTRLWWDPKRPDEPVMFNSTITLGEEFFDLLVERPVPVDMHVLKHLTRSPLSIDIYMWLTYRMSYLKDETAISWEILRQQFGADYERTIDFTNAAKKALRTIKLAWPELKYKTPRGRLVLQPSPTHVRRLTG